MRFAGYGMIIVNKTSALLTDINIRVAKTSDFADERHTLLVFNNFASVSYIIFLL